MKRKLLAINVAAAILMSSVTCTAWASTLTMSVNADKGIKEIPETMYGINSEWGLESEELYLDPDYGYISDFNINFEGQLTVAPQYGELYNYPTSTAVSKYIKNGSTYDGNASESSYVIDGDLYQSQYVGGVPQKPQEAIDGTVNNSYSFSGMLPDKLVAGGIDGYRGFSSRYVYQHMFEQNGKIDDLQVIIENDGNKVLSLAPVNINKTVFTKGVSSFFGKDTLGLGGEVSSFSARVKIVNEGEAVRLHLVKNGNLSVVGALQKEQGYGNVSTTQFLGNQGKASWIDVVTWKDGGVYVGDTYVCNYTSGVWNTVRVDMDLSDSENPTIQIKILDAAGEVIGSLTPDVSSMSKLTDCQIVKQFVTKPFDFGEDGYYAYMFSATSMEQNEYAKVLIDDMSLSSQARQISQANKKFYDGIKDYPMNFVRLGGGRANFIEWKKTLGEIDEREAFRLSNNDWNPSVQRLGIAEAIKAMTIKNPDVSFSYVLNLNDSTEDIIDLVEYLTANGDINGDGVDWSAKRRADGINSPVNVALWELGNELDLASNNSWTKEEYIAKCNEVIPALEQYTPNVKIGAHLSTYGESDFNPWLRALVDTYGNRLDYLIAHTYYQDDSVITMSDTYIDYILSYVKSKNLNIKVAFTEHATGRYYNADDINNPDTWYLNSSMAAVLQEAEFYNRNIIHQDTADICNYHSMIAGPWSLCYEDTNGDIKPNAMYEVLKLYAENGVGTALETTLDGFSSGTASDYSGVAVKQSDGSISVFLQNYSETASHSVEVLIDSKYKPISKTVISAPDWDSYNGADVSEISISRSVQESNTIELLPCSVIMVKYMDDAALTAQVKAEQASFDNKKCIRISGNAWFGNADIALLIKDKATGAINYAAQTKSMIDGKYAFIFENRFDLASSDCVLNINGIVHDITGEVSNISDVDDLFNIRTEEIGDEITFFYNNMYNVFDVTYTAFAAEYKDGMLVAVSEFKNGVLNNGENEFTLPFERTYIDSEVRTFVWTDLLNMQHLKKM